MWIINIKGEPNSNAWEISVIKEDDDHGLKSYGWFGENKRYISSSGGPCNYIVDEFTWNELIKIAKKVAKHLNERDFPKTKKKRMGKPRSTMLPWKLGSY